MSTAASLDLARCFTRLLSDNIISLWKKSERSLVECSGKMVFLFQLLENQVKLGHRVLIFSQSTRMLDIIQDELVDRRYDYRRIDGSITDTEERQVIIDQFNKYYHILLSFKQLRDTSIPCFLLTTQVGGLGLNLTSADRVVICMFLCLNLTNSV